MQIRRGDHTATRKDFQQRGYESITTYADAVVNVLKMHQRITQVFVMSDDFNSIIELSKLLSTHGNYTIAYMPTAPKRRGHHQGKWNSIATANKHDFQREIAELITELEIMRKADFVACSYYSGLCSVIQMIRSQPAETLIDVDSVGWSLHKIWKQ